MNFTLVNVVRCSQICDLYEIPSGSVLWSSDSANNCISALNQGGDEGYASIGCLSHLLQLCVNDGLYGDGKVGVIELSKLSLEEISRPTREEEAVGSGSELDSVPRAEVAEVLC